MLIKQITFIGFSSPLGSHFSSTDRSKNIELYVVKNVGKTAKLLSFSYK